MQPHKDSMSKWSGIEPTCFFHKNIFLNNGPSISDGYLFAYLSAMYIWGALHGILPGFSGKKKHGQINEQERILHTIINAWYNPFPPNNITSTVSETKYPQWHLILSYGLMRRSKRKRFCFFRFFRKLVHMETQQSKEKVSKHNGRIVFSHVTICGVNFILSVILYSFFLITMWSNFPFFLRHLQSVPPPPYRSGQACGGIRPLPTPTAEEAEPTEKSTPLPTYPLTNNILEIYSL